MASRGEKLDDLLKYLLRGVGSVFPSAVRGGAEPPSPGLVVNEEHPG